jgi:hypothetical protein
MAGIIPEQVADLIAEVLKPGHFFVAGGRELTCLCLKAEETAWEIFRGRLLGPAHTRERKVFRSWNLYLGEERQRPPEPILSLKWDQEARQIHVTRGSLCYVWEAYDAGDKVILSRENQKWLRELVGTLDLEHFPDPDGLRSELADRVFRAVVGTSRLPLNPVEAPLPAFSCGQFAFFDCPAGLDPPMRSFPHLIKTSLSASLPWLQAVKLLEFVLRIVRPEEIAEAARLFTDSWPMQRGRALGDFPKLFRTLFNEVSLSPYTSFVDNTLAFLQALVEQGAMAAEDQVDFLSYLLRQICRHLTAYDLITFHHRGANYPDALLLDAALKTYLELIESHSELFSGTSKPARLRRRALRQACLLRRYYEGHLVPDAPTSPGENARVLPPPHVRVPDEQILQPLKRRKQLYADDPTLQLPGPRARVVLQESLHDLHHPAELRELGTGLFIDRPLGTGKAAGEPDQTPLLSHEAFSRSLAARRLKELVDFTAELPLNALLAQLGALTVEGFPARDVALPDRPVASLADACRVADDFVFVRTLPESVKQLFELFDVSPLLALGLDFVAMGARLLIVAAADSPGTVAIYDGSLQRRLELTTDLDRGFRISKGIEFPAAGLKVRRVWEANASDGTLRPKQMPAEPMPSDPEVDHGVP